MDLPGPSFVFHDGFNESSIIFIDLDLEIHNKHSPVMLNLSPTSSVLVSETKAMIIILEVLIAYQCRLTYFPMILQ